MAKRRVSKNTKQSMSNKNNGYHDGFPLVKTEEAFQDHEGIKFHHYFENQSVAIRALRNVKIEQLRTMLRLLLSYFSKEQFQVPRLEKDGQCEVQWKDKDVNLVMNQADEKTLHASLLHRLSIAYPDCTAGFEFSNKSVKTAFFGADKFPIWSLVLEEPSDSQILDLKDGMQTPDACTFTPPLTVIHAIH
ncbi:hypothetical protein Pfo_012795 [Paulownia fortunei]|nr:hypothetical protein Pfo_012795 [Paulownia fortunei]